MTVSSSRAGGRATEAGMAFQAGVGAWFAAHLAGEMPIGRRFGLGADTVPTELQFETGSYLDDIELHLSDGGRLLVQCKTHPKLSAAPGSDLASTIGQLVELFGSEKSGKLTIDLGRSAAVLAIASDAVGSLDNLEQACRFFDAGGQWADAKARLNRSQTRALELFKTCVQDAWNEGTSGPLTENDLVSLARLFHITRFDVDHGGRDWREAARVIGSRLFGREEAGEAALEALYKGVRKLIRNGATANREGLMAALRAENLDDTRSPRFDRDIANLLALSREEVNRLTRHSRLPISGGVPIARECATSFQNAAENGSLLVTGEPGSGKTGLLVRLAEAKLASHAPIVFLSVDRYAGVATSNVLRAELHLEHPLLDVLAGWPGREPGLFFIDALDAARGDHSEGVFANLIEAAVARLGERWSIIASIRTFDLRNGRRFRTIMAGTPPDPAFMESGLGQVRHFRVPRLSESEVAALAKAHPELGLLVEGAPPSMRDLLRNVFNLSLAAELVAQGFSTDSIRTITTQSDLIDRYEDERLPNTRLQAAVKKAVQVMVERRRLAVPKISIMDDAIDDVLKAGVLAAVGDRVAFAHHILFDHAAGRFYLDWDKAEGLRAQVTGDPAISMLLAPSLRFAMERVWRDDREGRPTTWRLIASLTAVDHLDPIVTSVALRTVAERVIHSRDVEALCDLLRTGERTLGTTLSRLARFVGMSIAEADSIKASAATAWAAVAQVAIQTGEKNFVDGARLLLWALFEKGDFTASAFCVAFGKASRALLSLAWDTGPPLRLVATNAIRLVARSFGSDPGASRALLQRTLDEPHFSEHAHEEAPWLAEGVPSIVQFDPDFAAEIYATLFGRPAPQDGNSWFGGVASRILPLRSDRRQDYQHARWRLRQALPSFLRAAPDSGTRAVSAAAIGIASESWSRDRSRQREMHQVQVGSRSISFVEDDLSLQEWRGSQNGTAGAEDDVLVVFTNFLHGCAAGEFRVAVETATAGETATSVWARLFGIGAERLGIADDLLWPVASTMEVLGIRGMTRDVLMYLAAAYSNRTNEERSSFDTDLVACVEGEDQQNSQKWRSLMARFLSVVPEGALVTTALRTLRVKLDAEGRLVGNRPFVSIEIGSGSADDITDQLLERAGINLEEGADRDVRVAARALDDLLRGRNEALDGPRVVQLWSAAGHVIEVINRHVQPAPHDETLHASWGSVSNAIESIAKADAFNPDLDGHPSLSGLLWPP